MYMRLFLNKIFFLAVFFLSLNVCYGQEDTPPEPPPPTPPPGLPIDGGVLVLLFISILFGIYKIHQYNLDKKTPV